MKVRKEFNAPFGLMPELRLNLVKRWGIISMSKEQSVAEHSFNVAMITKQLCHRIGLHGVNTNSLIVQALEHDIDEIYSGDIPSPAKIAEDDDTVGHSTLVKIADIIEAYRFTQLHCNDTEEVQKWLKKGLLTSLLKKVQEYDSISMSDIDDLLNEHGDRDIMPWGETWE